MSLLAIKGLSIGAAGVPLVQGLSLTIEKGEILALVGESGSGKTLTAHSILGLLPDALRAQGEMAFEGDQWAVSAGQLFDKVYAARMKRLRGNRIGMIFQEPMTSLNPLHTIGKQVAEAVRIHQPALSKADVAARVQTLLDKVGLAHFSARLASYPHQLSGGERQRVMIAMAIANDPALLIADEPTTALDVTIQAQILALIQELRKRLGMAVLLITHDLPLVRRVADRVAIMCKGEVVETGKASEIFAQPHHAYTKKLLASEPGKEPAHVRQAPQPVLVCKHLSISFVQGAGFFGSTKTKTVLSDVSFEVPQGMTLGVVGESGSGKTSLALALLRLIASEGEICFFPRATIKPSPFGKGLGEGPVAPSLTGFPKFGSASLMKSSSPEGRGESDVLRLDLLSGKALRAARRDLQMVFQDPFSSLNPRMTVGLIVREGLDLHEPHLTHAEREARVDAVLSEVGLDESAKARYPHEFSGGQRQRISIARALILKPRLLILDEPTSALDLSVQAQILSLLKSLQEKYGLTYIFISHDLRVIRAISHRILVLEKGRMVEQGEAGQIFESPQAEYTRALIKAAML